jgi:hypothetical protein
MQTITLNCDRPAIELTRAGETVRWEYDVVELKIAFEGLEKQHKLVSRDVLSSPSASFLHDAATVLQGKGLEGCTPDIALRVYSVVRVQFKQIVADLAKQLSK